MSETKKIIIGGIVALFVAIVGGLVIHYATQKKDTSLLKAAVDNFATASLAYSLKEEEAFNETCTSNDEEQCPSLKEYQSLSVELYWDSVHALKNIAPQFNEALDELNVIARETHRYIKLQNRNGKASVSESEKYQEMRSRFRKKRGEILDAIRKHL